MSKTDIMIIAGNRPEIIKLSELISSLKDENSEFLYTGQHYSSNMKDIFLEELGIKPDVDLQCGTSEVATLKHQIVKYLQENIPNFVAVYGDTNTTYAGALATKEVPHCKLIHLEAGLRSFDRTSVEERNRTLVDSMSDILLAPTELSRTFLSYERSVSHIHVPGNMIVDICKKFSKYISNKSMNVPKSYLLLTVHRAENVDDPHILSILSKRLAEIPFNIVFPIHPRTRKNLLLNNIDLPTNVQTIEPVGYLEFLALMKFARLVLTDSGGVQEEAIVLGKPCITLRNTTERWETILLKANMLFRLYGSHPNSLKIAVEEMLDHRTFSNPYGENVTIQTKKILMNYVNDPYAIMNRL